MPHAPRAKLPGGISARCRASSARGAQRVWARATRGRAGLGTRGEVHLGMWPELRSSEARSRRPAPLVWRPARSSDSAKPALGERFHPLRRRMASHAESLLNQGLPAAVAAHSALAAPPVQRVGYRCGSVWIARRCCCSLVNAGHWYRVQVTA